MSKPWGGVGAWALEAERAEAEELEIAAAAAAAAPAALFPSLKDAAASKPKKKKPVPISLSEFHVGPTPAKSAGAHRIGLTHDEMLRLPTGPKERSQEEIDSSRFGGGGFRSYGGGYGGGGGDRSSGSGSRRPYGGGFDEEGRRAPSQSRDSDLDLPSRADEVDNWASTKKPFPMESGPGRHERQDRYSSLGGGGSSKADEVDNWASAKKQMAPVQAPSRYSGFGSGFRDSTGGGAASGSDRWARDGGGPSLHAPDNGEKERPRLVLDPPKVGPSGTEVAASEGRSRPSPFGVARPREEVLAEKGVDWRKIDTEIETKKSTSRPTSSQSNRPTSSHSSRPGSPGGEGGKPRPKVNPFGDARPREVLLQEKGKDWRKIDSELEHRSVDRPETDEEKLLREEINHLKKELTKETEGNVNGDLAEHSAELITSLSEQISQREKDLERLIHDLDDKVRFGQKASSEMRPGSGAGRISDRPPSQSGRISDRPPSRSGRISDRPPSRSGMSEDSRNMDFMERPRSRGGLGDSWAKPVDDRRGFQGSRESSFFGSRNNDRPRRDGW